MCAAKKVGTGFWDSNLLPVFWIVGRMEPREIVVAMAQALEEVRKQREELQQQVGPVGSTASAPARLTSLPPLGAEGADTGPRDAVSCLVS